MNRIRAILADSHRLFAEGLRAILKSEIDVVEIVNEGGAAVEAFERLKPDIILLGIDLAGISGIEAARGIKRVSPEARILFVSMYSDRVYVEEAFAAGAAGYVLKSAAGREVFEAIREVMEGRRYVSRALRRDLWKPDRRLRSRVSADRLTPRQREVLRFVVEGKAMKEIAAILKVSVRTIEFHKNSMMRGLGCHSTADLIRYAVHHSIALLEASPSARSRPAESHVFRAASGRGAPSE